MILQPAQTEESTILPSSMGLNPMRPPQSRRFDQVGLPRTYDTALVTFGSSAY